MRYFILLLLLCFFHQLHCYPSPESYDSWPSCSYVSSIAQPRFSEDTNDPPLNHVQLSLYFFRFWISDTCFNRNSSIFIELIPNLITFDVRKWHFMTVINVIKYHFLTYMMGIQCCKVWHSRYKINGFNLTISPLLLPFIDFKQFVLCHGYVECRIKLCHRSSYIEEWNHKKCSLKEDNKVNNMDPLTQIEWFFEAIDSILSLFLDLWGFLDKCLNKKYKFGM